MSTDPYKVYVGEVPAPHLPPGEHRVHRRVIQRDVGGVMVSVDITHCPWCGNTETVCTACSSRLDDACREVEEGAR